MDQWRYNDLALSTTGGRSAMMPFSTPWYISGRKRSPEQARSPQRLRALYRQNADPWTERELARLRLVHGLVQAGRLMECARPPTGDTGASGQ
jgi:hypothetical protein